MEWNELLNEIVKILTPALLSIILTGSTYLGYQANKFIKSKFSNEKLKQIETIVEASVMWVEQITGIDVKYESEEKFKFAKERVIFHLNEMGIQVSDELIETLIEAFVNELNFNKGEDK